MAISENNSGTQTAVISTKYTVPGAAITADGAFAFAIDVSNMANGDTLKITRLRQVETSSGVVEDTVAILSHAQAFGVFETDPEPSFHSLQYSFTQTAGTGRLFEWSIAQAS